MQKCISWLNRSCKYAKTKSWMIAGYPDAASLSKIIKLKNDLNLEDAEEIFGREYFHVTLRYWKDDDDPMAEKVKEWLEENIDIGSVECDTSKLEVIGDKDSLVITLKSERLNRLQKSIDDAIVEIGVPPSDFPTFKAHLTLAQGVKEAPELPKDFKITLSKWKFTNKDEEVLWQA
jgi:2'-5' RNA ligase